MILLIKICYHPLHYFEFVKPIEDIVKKESLDYISIHYRNITKEILNTSDKIIICGTSLKDDAFLGDIHTFQWIKKYNKPMLGICGGMHILGLIYEGHLKKQKEIGLYPIQFDEEFLGMKGKKQVYELHKYIVQSNYFKKYATSQNCHQAIKHTKKPIYGVIFHPEVRNKELITQFIHTVNQE
ncbi:MAG: hypothetical protein R6V50_03925 [Thermoplasmatota archaeon]